MNQNNKTIKRASGSSNQVNKRKKRKSNKNRDFTASLMNKTPVVRALLTLLIIILITSVLVSSVSSIYSLAYIFGSSKINLDYYKNNQDQTSIIYAVNKDGKPVEVASLHGEENRKWVSLDKIPKDVQNAFIALEDKRFRHHSGVDWIRLSGVIVKHRLSQGGSTITQQLIKNLTGENDVIISRKAHEILQALNLEKNYDKDKILEAYLNTIPLGSGCYGVQTAAEKYFNKDVSELNAAEGAVLASITKAPTFYNPIINPENNKKRMRECLKQMEKQHLISKSQYKEMLNYDIKFNFSGEKLKESKNVTNTVINSYYVDYIIDNLTKDFMDSGYSNQEAIKKIYYGGLRIYSTIQVDAQNKVEDIFVNRKGIYSKQTQAAITIMDYKGQIVAMVGGVGPKTVNRGLNRAVDSVRQPGSSIKPLSAYAPNLQSNKIHFSKMIPDFAITKDGEKWPQNYDGSFGSENKKVTVQYALQDSLNTSAVRMVLNYGTRNSFNFLVNKFHFSTLIKDGKDSDANLSSLGVGGMSKGVNTLEMAAAYAVFGNGGEYYKPYIYTKVTDNSGKKVYFENKNVKGEKVIDESTAYIMNQLLQTVVSRGTARGCGVSGFDTFMKTGTTTENKDKWGAGGTPYYVGAVWYGYDQPKPLDGSAATAAKLLGLSLNAISRGLPSKKFEMPSDVVKRNYYPGSGLLVKEGDSTSGTMVGYYKKDFLPDEGGAPATSETTTESADEANSTTKEQDKETTKPSTTSGH